MAKDPKSPPKSKPDVLSVENFAHLERVRVAFGDLTILVGPQASGKSLILQLFKLVVDGRAIKRTFQHFGLVIKGEKRFLSRYLGQGMEDSWREDSKVSWRGREVTLTSAYSGGKHGPSSVYFVPAHRTLTLSEGYPPTFQQFKPETPFVVRQFSEELRQVLIEGIGRELLFPQAKRLKGKVREKIDEAIFHGAELREDASGVERQLRLKYSETTSLSYMTWTAGQREFIPLLLGLYYLLPAGAHKKRAEIDWVIIEEPEMGLHPKAVMAIMLLILDLLSRGYKVVISTHSPLVLEIVWALNILKRNRGTWQSVLKMFDIQNANKADSRGEVEMAEAALKKNYKVYLFDFKGGLKVHSRNISALDPSSDDADVAGWGGLTGMSGKIGSVVSETITANQAKTDAER